MTLAAPASARPDLRLARATAAFGLFCWVEYACWLAVLLYAYQRGGVGLTGVVGVAQLVPAALLAPLFGPLGDRWPRGAALAGAYAAEGVAMAALAGLLAAGAPVTVVVIAAAVATLAVSVARPIHYAALPQLATTPRALVAANSGSGVAEGVGGFTGPVLAGVLVDRAGPWLVVAVGAAAMAVAAALCLALRLPSSCAEPDGEGGPNDASGGSPLRDAAAGFVVVSRDRAVLALLLVLGFSFLVSGALEVLGVTFARAVLDGTDATAGILLGATGIGALLGAAAAGGLAFQSRLAGPTTLAVVAAGLPLLLMALVRSTPPAVLLLALSGGGTSFASVAATTLLQRSSDGRVLARVFAVREGITLAGLAAGAALAPLLVALLGAGDGYLPLAVGLVVLAAAGGPTLRRLDLRVVVRTDVLVALRGVPFLAPMSPPALERLAKAAGWLEVAPGDVVVRQGDAGDAFYVVAEGELLVSVDGVVREHRLGAADGFGEIALLHDIPRSATVVALSAARLLRVGRDDFLAAVTGSPDGHVIARRVAQAHLERDSGRAPS